MCLCLHIGAHTKPQKYTRTLDCANVYQQFIFTFFIIISRDSNLRVCVCMRLTFCFSFITCSVSICFTPKKNYINTRQATSTFNKSRWSCHLFFRLFLSISVQSSFAAISYKILSCFACALWQQIQSIFFIIIVKWIWAETTSCRFAAK